MTFVDAPQLNSFLIVFSNEIDFDFGTPQLVQFIDRTPKLSKHDEAHVVFDYLSVRVTFGPLAISLSFRESDRLLSPVAHFCNSSLTSTVEVLYIEHRSERLVWQNDAMESTLWLQLLLPFTAVKNLHLCKEFAPGIAAALQELVGARITEVLPSLRNIFVRGLEPSGSFQENIGQFVAARQLSDHPIAISVWDKGSNMKPM